MQASPSEIYLIDAATLQFVDANLAACSNLQYDVAALADMTPFTVAPLLTTHQMNTLLASLSADIGAEVTLHTEHRRRDGSAYPVTLRLLRASHDGRALLLAVSDGNSQNVATAAALAQYQSRFDAIVSNTPGLVYQFCQHDDGRIAFPYLSDGCLALLGLTAAQLRQDPALFLNLILEDDRAAYLASMQASAAALWSWNWEGRIWVDAWKDVKWINLRSTPRRLAAPDSGVQWEGIMTNITESKLEQLEVKQSRARLAELTAHIDKVKEQERTRIAREIHDDLGGNLTAIKMALAMLSQRLGPAPAGGGDDAEEAPLSPAMRAQMRDKADYVDTLVDRTIDAVHRISLDLRPSMLDLGIVAALEWQLREFEKQTGVSCSFSASDTEIDLELDHATALFRIFQEALTNIAKHAHASRVTVRLARLRHHISLKITDNGGGIWQADRAKPQSFGLRGMAERASALGGTLTLSHASGGGTVVSIKVRLATPRNSLIAAAAAGVGTGQ
jgi:signal transduction histidine kinase